MYINTICGYYSNARLFGAEKHCNTILSTKSKYLSIKLRGSIDLVCYDSTKGRRFISGLCGFIHQLKSVNEARKCVPFQDN